MKRGHIYFHLHLVSDSTGETLLTVGRAAAARYESIAPIEHVYPLVRSARHLERVIADIEASPGIVLYTLVERDIAERLEAACRDATLPCLNVLDPIVDVFRSYLNLPATGKAGAQHALDADYFRRIDALNFTMMHDDGVLPEDIEEADIVLIGVSRTSKTPTSIYLANRGIRATNMPLVPDVPIPEKILKAQRPLVVGLIASPERIMHIRQNRLLSLNAGDRDTPYVDKHAIAREVAYSRRLCTENGWPMIDVTRRSIEETAAAILALYDQHRYGRLKESFV
ncbi:pyruvate, water dikinase regulatory protein [Chthonobacter rhizosphaerae]|uniref:pyruvate, water dikinase regulatory protein n=1 Tax=Chthonobacter rhizosphaerae TaxID=2735553 RepID=UPI0015EF79A0|nr:pyruvate, water dikinase regulatory protein [Chthonobacter rhizosphaerae]